MQDGVARDYRARYMCVCRFSTSSTMPMRTTHRMRTPVERSAPNAIRDADARNARAQ